jgi:peptide/nickel transport system substrate-binding protein
LKGGFPMVIMQGKVSKWLGLCIAVMVMVVSLGGMANAATMGLTFGWAYPTHFNHFAPNSMPGSGLINDPLAVQIRVTGEYIPRLAAEWEEAGTTLTVKLREDVKWHDGVSFTSADVVDTFLLGKVLFWAVWDNIENVVALDDHTVQFELSKRASLPRDLVVKQVLGQFIYPSHLYGQFLPEDTAPILAATDIKDPLLQSINEELISLRPETFVGTGPFKVAGVTQARIMYEKNDDYYLADRVKIDDIVVYQSMQNQVAWQVRLTDKTDFDWAGSPKPVQEQWLRKPGAKLALPWDFATYGLYFNTERLPINVRKAIAYAVDRELLTAVASFTNVPEESPTGLSPFTAEEWLSEDVLSSLEQYEYNPEKSKELLLEAGYKETEAGWLTPEGDPFEVTVIAPAGWSDWVITAESVAVQLSAIGIEATATAVEQPGYWQQQSNGDYDMSIGWIGMWQVDPYMQYRGLFVQNGTCYNATPEQYLRFGPEVDVPGLGKVNIKELTQRAASSDLEEKREAITALARLVNEELPLMGLNAKRLQTFYSTARFVGWPEEDSVLWQNVGGDALSALALFITHSGLRPK